MGSNVLQLILSVDFECRTSLYSNALFVIVTYTEKHSGRVCEITSVGII